MLKKLLEKLGFKQEDITKIEEGMSKDKIYVTDVENASEEITRLTSEKDNLQKVTDANNKIINNLKKNNSDNEDLQSKIKEHEDTIKKLQKDHEDKVKELIIDRDINTLLSSNNAKYADLLSSKFDRTKLEVKDGKTLGLSEQFETMKTQYSDMFGQAQSSPYNYSPNAGDKGGQENGGVSNLLNIITENQVKR